MLTLGFFSSQYLISEPSIRLAFLAIRRTYLNCLQSVSRRQFHRAQSTTSSLTCWFHYYPLHKTIPSFLHRSQPSPMQGNQKTVIMQTLSIRRQDMEDTRSPGRLHDDLRESVIEVPNLVTAHSGSSFSRTSSSPSSTLDASTFSHLSSNKKKQRSYKKNYHQSGDDSSILRGAEILRRQILQLDDSLDDDEALLLGPGHCFSNDAIQRMDYLEPQDEDDDEDGSSQSSSDDWSDPWRGTNNTRSLHDQQGEQQAIIPLTASWGEEEEAEEKTAFGFPAEEDAGLWAHLSDSEDDEDDDNTVLLLERAKQQQQQPPPPPPPPRVSPDNSPEIFIGRNGTLRTKVEETYIVQRVDGMDTSTFDSSFDDGSLLHLIHLGSDERSYLPGGLVPVLDTSRTSSGSPFILTRKFEDRSFPTDSHSHALDLLTDLAQSEEAEEKEETAYLLKATKRDRNARMMALPKEPSPCDHIVPPKTPQYEALMKDPGFLHAQRAGTLWQSLVSQHVRFSSKWWNGARSPPMGVAERRLWNYAGRHRVKENHFLNGFVRNRGSAGRLLLHVIVRDIMTGIPIQDIAIGCFHPNARGVRMSSAFDPSLEDCRDIWVALRQRVDDISVIESLLKRNEDDDNISESPLGGKHAVDNTNMRAVFGETPPVNTVFVAESEVYELFSHHLDGHTPPAAMLLQQFLKDW
jgi:hypothetical protein